MEKVRPKVREFAREFYREERNKLAIGLLDQTPGSREKVHDFYKRIEREYQTHSVEAVSQKHGVVFIHGIMPDITPNPNSVIKPGVSWKRKLDILLALHPTISTSTIQKGDTDREMWSRMGLVISQGRILSASRSDLESRAITLNLRRFGEEEADLEAKIKDAIDNRDQSLKRRRREFYDYNELVVQGPQVAGFYVCADRAPEAATDERLHIKDAAPLEEISEYLAGLGLPLFVFKNGILYEGKYDIRKRILKSGSQINMKAISSLKYQLTYERHAQIIDSILDDSPFKLPTEEKPEAVPILLFFGETGGNPDNKIGLPELSFMHSRDSGRKLYMQVNTLAGVLPNFIEEINLGLHEEFSYEYKKERGDKAYSLGVIEEIDDTNEYAAIISSLGNKLFSRRIYEDGRTQTWMSVTNMHSKLIDNYDPILTLGRIGHGRLILNRPIKNNDDYLSEIEKFIQIGARYMNMTLYSKPREEIEEIVVKMRKIAFHIFGYADQAASWGDMQTKNRGYEIASRIISAEEYQNIISQRIGKNGKFRLTKVDLGITKK